MPASARIFAVAAAVVVMRTYITASSTAVLRFERCYCEATLGERRRETACNRDRSQTNVPTTLLIREQMPKHDRQETISPRKVVVSVHNLCRYASRAARSSGAMNPRSTWTPSDETIAGNFGGGFKRATRLKNAR